MSQQLTRNNKSSEQGQQIQKRDASENDCEISDDDDRTQRRRTGVTGPFNEGQTAGGESGYQRLLERIDPDPSQNWRPGRQQNHDLQQRLGYNAWHDSRGQDTSQYDEDPWYLQTSGPHDQHRNQPGNSAQQRLHGGMGGLRDVGGFGSSLVGRPTLSRMETCELCMIRLPLEGNFSVETRRDPDGLLNYHHQCLVCSKLLAKLVSNGMPEADARRSLKAILGASADRYDPDGISTRQNASTANSHMMAWMSTDNPPPLG